MKVESDRRTITMTKGLGFEHAEIAASAHVFKILSEQYKEPEEALIREPGTNLVDAYIPLPPGAEIRNPVIHLPNELEPYLSFRDFGVGMSRQGVRDATDYAKSTKQMDNAAVGGFGIGLNMLYFYKGTDQWVMCSWRDGLANQAVCMKNEQGYPGRVMWPQDEEHAEAMREGGFPEDVIQVHVEAAHRGGFTFDEAAQYQLPIEGDHGTYVEIQIDPADFGIVKQKVKKFLKYWEWLQSDLEERFGYKLEIEVIGDPEFEVEPIDYLLRGDTWGIRKYEKITNSWGGSRYNYGGGYQPPQSYVIMGNIPYPIEAASLANYSELTNDNVKEFGLDLKLPVGAADIVPSREGLMYTDRTKAAIHKAVLVFQRELKSLAQGLVKNSKTQWEALENLQDCWGVPSLRKLVKGTKWRGIDLKPVEGIEFDVQNLRKTLGDDLVVEKFNNSIGKIEVSRLVDIGTGNLSPHDNVKVMVDDLDRTMVRRVRHDIREDATARTTYSGRAQGGREVYTTYVFRNDDQDLDVEAVKTALGGFPVTKVSDLPDPHVSTASSGGGTKTTSRVPLRYLDGSDFDMADGVDLDDGGLYVRINNNYPMDFSGTSSLAYVVRRLRDVGILDQDEKVWAVPRSRSSVENKDGWLELKETIMPKLNHLIGVNTQNIADFKAWQAVLGDHLLGFLQNTDLRRFNKDTTPHTIGTVVRDIASNQRKMQSLIELADHLGIKIAEKDPSTDGKALVAQLKKEYPLLEVIDETDYYGRVYKQKEDEIVEYIRSMDKLRDYEGAEANTKAAA